MTFYCLTSSTDPTKQIAGHIVFRNPLGTEEVYSQCFMSSHGYIISIEDLKDDVKKEEFISNHF